MKKLMLLALISPVLANDTAINSGGHGPAPLGEFQGEESVIRMVSENIEIRMGKTESQVTCRFTFRSSKQEGEAKQTVGFPDLLDLESDTGTISKLETFVDGKQVEAKKVRGWFGTSEWGTPKSGLGDPPSNIPKDEIQYADYYTVELSFPPDKDVIVERKYTADNGGDAMGSTGFSYTTHTGAVWKDTIGSAEFRVILDGWTVDDLAFEDGKQKVRPRDQSAWCSPNLAEWKVVSPTELKMTWKDFEPAVHRTRRGIFLATWSKKMSGE
jgi:hypothetical protein